MSSEPIFGALWTRGAHDYKCTHYDDGGNRNKPHDASLRHRAAFFKRYR
jgi:hypothetical protein